MKVLIVINGLGTGGAERSTSEAIPELRDRGVDVVVACLFRRTEGVQRSVIEQGTPIHFLDARHFIGRVIALRRLIRTERPDVVHTVIFEADLAGRLGSAGTGIPVMSSLVNTSYDPVRLEDPNISAIKLKAIKAIDGWTARHLTNHFHAITNTVKSAAITDLGIKPDRVTVVERGRTLASIGILSPQRRRAARKKLAIPQDAEVLINVGRQEFQKGQRYLIEAFGNLVPERPKSVLLVAGRRGNASAELDKIIGDLGLAGRVRMLGHRDDIPEVLCAADVAVMPSLYEGLGGALLEMMALGLPIVATDIAAFREVTESGIGALLVPPRDSIALASGITALFEDSALATGLGQRGRGIFCRRFELDGIATRMAELYRAVATRDDVSKPRIAIR
jgi:glycosyltransferase involved in cell wall biosynthesis